MAIFTRALVIMIILVVIFTTYLSASRGWWLTPLNNPAITKQYLKEEGIDAASYYSSSGSSTRYRSGVRSNYNSRINRNNGRSFRGGSRSGGGK